MIAPRAHYRLFCAWGGIRACAPRIARLPRDCRATCSMEGSHACAIHHHCCAACLHRAWYARCMGGRQTAITAVSRSVLVIVRGVRSDAIPSRDAPLLGSDDCIVSARALVGLGPHSASSPRLTWQHHTGFPLTSTPARSFPVRQDVLHLRPTTTDLPHPHRIVSDFP